MKKSNRILLVALLLVLACTISVLAYALPAATYQNTLITEKFSENKPNFSSGVSFNGYPGNFTVGSFVNGYPSEYAPYTAFATAHDILCHAASGTDGDQWTRGGMYLGYKSGGTPGRMILVGGYTTAIGYTVPYTGNVSISFAEFALYNGTGSAAALSADFAIYRNGEQVWPTDGAAKTYASPDTVANAQRYSPSTPAVSGLDVRAGDILTFAVSRNNSTTQYAYISPNVSYNNYGGEEFSQKDSFNPLINGAGGWYAMYGMPGRDAAYLLTGDTENALFGGVDGAGTVSAGRITVGDTYETVLIFRSPMIATYTLSVPEFTANGAVTIGAFVYRAGCEEPKTQDSRPNDYDENGLPIDGFFSSANIPRNECEVLFPARTAGEFADVTDIYLDRGDLFVLRFTPTEGGASAVFAPVMTATEVIRDTSLNGDALTPLMGEKALCPDVRLTATAISLTGRVNMYFYAHFTNTTAAWANEFGILYFDADETDFTYKNGKALPLAQKDGKTFAYLLSDINAKEMSDRFFVRAYAKAGDTVIYDEVRSCSVRDTAMQYRDAYMGSQTAKNAALYALACDMLNYGAAAQTVLGYRTDDLANRYLTEAEKAVDAPVYANNYSKKPGDAAMAGIKFYAVTLMLEDLPRFRMFVDLPADADLSRLTLQMATDANFTNIKETYSLADCPLWSGNMRRVLSEGIAPADLKTVYYFRITDGTSYSEVLSYSAESYAARMQNESAELRATLDAMFTYSEAVGEYITASTQPTAGTAISSAQLLELIRKNALTANAIYTLTDLSPLLFSEEDNGAVYDLKGITVITESGLILAETEGLTLKNFTLSVQNTKATAVTVLAVRDSVLEGITVTGVSACGVRVDGECDRLFLRDSMVEGCAVGIVTSSDAKEIYLTSLSVHSTSGAALEDGADAFVSDSTLTSDGATAVLLTGNGTELRGNTVSASTSGIAVRNAKNILIAQNSLNGCGISVTESDSVTVILNTASTVSATDNTHLYAISNTLSSLTLKNNNYLIADANSGTVTASGNRNHNGDSVTDVNARLEAGADEALLPHVDLEQFVGMARKDTVRTASGEYVPVLTYINSRLKSGEPIILAPGAYATYDRLFLSGAKDVAIYGFGVLLERQGGLSSIITVDSSDNIQFHGLTIGYAQQSCGQVYVLDKLADNKLLVVTGAGMMNEFGNTNTSYFKTTGMGAQREGTFYAYCDTSFLSIEKLANGLMEMSVSASVYQMIAEGDILTCRAVNGGTTVPSSNSKDLLFKDMVVYGSAAGFAFNESYNRSSTSYYRVADTTKSGFIIDKATYDWYASLESTYGVDLEISVDELGRYRGSLPHIGSIDATHTTRCVGGSRVTSCLFENMCDDGTNQNAVHGRIASIVNNGDGTATVTYKGSWSEYNYGNKYHSTGGLCAPFEVGDRVFIYTSKGQLVCDTSALSVSAKVGSALNQKMKDQFTAWVNSGAVASMPTDAQMTYSIYTVTVDASAVNFNALNGFDLTDDGWQATNKVLIDNMTRSSNGFLFDNTIVRNIRSRGLLIKASNASITNCTFENIGMGAVAILYEIYWGESGVTENLEVSRNRFIHTGYFNNIDRYSPIAIEGLGSSSDADYLLYKNISITDNVIESRTTNYAVFINSAKDITVTGNTFGPKYKLNGTVDTAYNGGIVHIIGANGVKIEGNSYPEGCTVIAIKQNALNVTGKDLETGIGYTMDSFAGAAPTVNGNAVTYHGNWTMGYFKSSVKPNTYTFLGGYQSFTYYSTSGDSGWITAGSSSLWGNKGGIWYANGYRMASLNGYNVAICYTAPAAGSFRLQLTSFLAPSGDGGKNGGFAIFKNGDMIWPTKGGSVSNASSWYTVSTATTLDQINAELAKLGEITLNKGDKLYFASKQTDGGWSNFAVLPGVIEVS